MRFFLHETGKMAMFRPQGINGKKTQKAADVWKKNVWDFQSLSQTFLELRFSLGNKGEDGKNLNSQTWPATPRRPSPKHPRPPEKLLNPPSQTPPQGTPDPGNSLCLGPLLPSKYRQNAYLKNFEGGGVWGALKFFMLNFFACFFCT